MYEIIEHCVVAFVPLFERVLTDCKRENLPWRRIKQTYHYEPGYTAKTATQAQIITPNLDKGPFKDEIMHVRKAKTSLSGVNILIVVKLTTINLVRWNLLHISLSPESRYVDTREPQV